MKIRELRVQWLLIRDLIVRVRDVSDEWKFQRVLDHWEVTNNKMLRKYPEDYVIGQDQIDEVVRSSMDMSTVDCEHRERSSYRGTVRVSEHDFHM